MRDNYHDPYEGEDNEYSEYYKYYEDYDPYEGEYNAMVEEYYETHPDPYDSNDDYGEEDPYDDDDY